MIRYALRCARDHGFEGWFRSSEDYAAQRKRRLVVCPACGSAKVEKAVMAPSVQGVEERAPAAAEPPVPVAMSDPRDAAMREALRRLREHVVASSEDVGDRFAEEARKIHKAEAEPRSIRGRATPDEAQALREDGVEFAPLPTFPEDQN
jgi:hypothetical protein